MWSLIVTLVPFHGRKEQVPSPNLEFTWLNAAMPDLALITVMKWLEIPATANCPQPFICWAGQLPRALLLSSGALLDWHPVEMTEIPQVLARESVGKAPFLASEWVVNLESGPTA